jgi:hypothetical protein
MPLLTELENVLECDFYKDAAPTALKFQRFCDVIRVHPCLSVVEKI